MTAASETFDCDDLRAELGSLPRCCQVCHANGKLHRFRRGIQLASFCCAVTVAIADRIGREFDPEERR